MFLVPPPSSLTPIIGKPHNSGYCLLDLVGFRLLFSVVGDVYRHAPAGTVQCFDRSAWLRLPSRTASSFTHRRLPPLLPLSASRAFQEIVPIMDLAVNEEFTRMYSEEELMGARRIQVSQSYKESRPDMLHRR